MACEYQLDVSGRTVFNRVAEPLRQSSALSVSIDMHEREGFAKQSASALQLRSLPVKINDRTALSLVVKHLRGAERALCMPLAETKVKHEQWRRQRGAGRLRKASINEKLWTTLTYVRLPAPSFVNKSLSWNASGWIK